MKILVVSGEYPPMKGGVGRYTKNLVQAIAKKPNVDVSVATSAAASNAATIDPSHDSNNNVTIYPGAIRKGDKRNSDRILGIVSDIKPDVVNIQYERGLYEVDTTIRHTFWRLVHGSILQNVPSTNSIHAAYCFSSGRIFCLCKG